MQHTDDIAREEGVDPAHDQGVRYDHGHLPLHGAHHALHGVGVCHGVRRRLAPVLGRLEVRPGLVGRGQRVAAGVEAAPGEDVEVRPDLDAVREGSLLPDRLEVLCLGGRREEDGCVVAEDTGQYLKGARVSYCPEREEYGCYGRYRIDRSGASRTMTIVMGNRIQ